MGTGKGMDTDEEITGSWRRSSGRETGVLGGVLVADGDKVSEVLVGSEDDVDEGSAADSSLARGL